MARQPGLAMVQAAEGEGNFFSKVFAAAAQGATAAAVAAVLSACTEPLVNRLLVKRQTFAQAWAEITLKDTTAFFLTTFPTNMMKFPVFEVINMALSFTSLSGSVRGVVNGFLFCSLMLPVTNYRFRKSMGWDVKASDLYTAYVPTVTRDIIYGWARGVVGGLLMSNIAPETSFGSAFVFGVTVWAACIISSPCNEWRGYTLQPANKKLPFSVYFKPVNYARSTGVGALIMGVSLMVGRLITPYAEGVFAVVKGNPMYSGIALLVVLVAGMALQKKK